MSTIHPGAFAYLIETQYGSILWKDTSGHWTGTLRGLRPGVALPAAAGRGNIDGNPIRNFYGAHNALFNKTFREARSQ